MCALTHVGLEYRYRVYFFTFNYTNKYGCHFFIDDIVSEAVQPNLNFIFFCDLNIWKRHILVVFTPQLGLTYSFRPRIVASIYSTPLDCRGIKFVINGFVFTSDLA